MSKIPLLISNLRDLSIPESHTSYIIPGKLYPAIAGKDINGDAIGTYTYGDVHVATGLKYYYTDIKGSKPIKDPRIGAHFGSQRHMFKSLQLLEQETATHGKQVHSVDGRGWVRVVEGVNEWYIENTSNGLSISVDDDATGQFLEVTGYFNDINLIGFTCTDRANDVDITVNGDSSSRVDGATTFDTVTCSPLGGRYVSSGSVLNLGTMTALGSSTLKAELGTTPAINTVKIEYMASGFNERLHGIELIVQDTTSTATKSQIQIPAQDVVSYGKKISLSASTPHYDPFNGFTSGTDISTYIDTATSLGMAKWKVSSTYYRPYNGMRVVKWVGTDGIKTSVTVIPPNAKSIKDADISKKADASAANDTYLPTFEAHTTSIDEDLLSEVAKTFHYREFGNGAANGGAGATYADASMLNTPDDIAYVMDDGLTSLSGDDVLGSAGGNGGLSPDSTNDYYYITFIGTGFSLNQNRTNATPNSNYTIIVDGVTVKTSQVFTGTGAYTLVQNLPYGTHIVKIQMTDSSSSTYSTAENLTFYQPKLPPIPEDAVVLADYMLMADHIIVGSVGQQYISKGVRRVDGSRDIFYDSSGSPTLQMHLAATSGLRFNFGSSNVASKVELPAFCTNQVQYGHDVAGRYMTYAIDSGSGYSDVTPTAKTGSSDAAFYNNTGNVHALGLVKHKAYGTAASSSAYCENIDVVTPIHTSSHYQSFETPFLHELVGGDRNMEQTNLICSPDGKTWDEVTRDTSYIGNNCINTSPDAGSTNTAQDDHPVKPTRWRGTETGSSDYRVKTWYNKDFAIAYDRVICLRDGLYGFNYKFRVTSSVGAAGSSGILLNWSSGTANQHIQFHYHIDGAASPSMNAIQQLKRGDTITWMGPNMEPRTNNMQIYRIK